MQQPIPGGVHVEISFDEALAHLVYAGSDLFLMPSTYEPCGLGQMIAMRYGTIPVAFATGGLADTITPLESPDSFLTPECVLSSETGFLFSSYTKESFLEAIGNALYAYGKPRLWQTLVRQAMTRDFSWQKSALQYLRLYEGQDPPV